MSYNERSGRSCLRLRFPISFWQAAFPRPCSSRSSFSFFMIESFVDLGFVDSYHCVSALFSFFPCSSFQLLLLFLRFLFLSQMEEDFLESGHRDAIAVDAKGTLCENLVLNGGEQVRKSEKMSIYNYATGFIKKVCCYGLLFHVVPWQNEWEFSSEETILICIRNMGMNQAPNARQIPVGL